MIWICTSLESLSVDLRLQYYSGHTLICMENCSFSSIDDCHQTKFVKVATLRSVRKDSEDLELLHLRTKIPKRNITNICGHHERMLLTKYSDLQTRCCDPFNKHQKPQTKGLKII